MHQEDVRKRSRDSVYRTYSYEALEAVVSRYKSSLECSNSSSYCSCGGQTARQEGNGRTDAVPGTGDVLSS